MSKSPRLPKSVNQFSEGSSPWGHSDYVSDESLLLNKMGARCSRCQRVTRNRFLETHNRQRLCPDCRAPSKRPA